MDIQVLIRFVIAAALGFVIGLQREQASLREGAQEGVGGIRTFPIVALLGSLLYTWNSAFPWLFVAGLLSVAAILVASVIALSRQGVVASTTIMSLLLTYALGGLVGDGQLLLASALAILLTLLLTLKVELHEFAHRVSPLEMLASLKLAVVSAVILPLLPNKSYGPIGLEVFNPFQIWLLVVMISGIGWVGYVLVRWVGSQRGIGVTGILGGLASSTALTVNFTQRSKENPSASPMLALGIVVAWTVMFVRVLAIAWIVAPEVGKLLVGPMLFPVIPGLVWTIALWVKTPKDSNVEQVNFKNPFELVPALKFVAVILLVVIVSRLSHAEFGDSGLLLSSFLTGLADVDAIAISVGQISLGGDASIQRIAATSVVLAAIANTIAKGSIASFLGSRNMRKPIGVATILMVLSGVFSVIYLMR